MAIIPIGNRLLVKPIPKEDEEIGNIIMPGTANANLLRGEVVKLSVDESMQDKDGNPFFKIGDVVLFQNNSGFKEREGKDFLLWLQIGEVWGLDN